MTSFGAVSETKTEFRSIFNKDHRQTQTLKSMDKVQQRPVQTHLQGSTLQLNCVRMAKPTRLHSKPTEHFLAMCRFLMMPYDTHTFLQHTHITSALA